MPGGNSAYSPLPQSNSDSDGSSEEELRVSQDNRVVNRIAKTQNSKTEKTYNRQKNNIINYKPLDGDRDVGVTLIKFQPSTDEVSILKPNNSLEMFSTSRKICFVISLLLCIFTTVVFIWILPCDIESCPKVSARKVYNYIWEETFSDLEIYGPISVVQNFLGRNDSLIFFTRSSLGSALESHPENGLMCLHGNNGSLSWNITLNNQPTDINCKLVDVNADGFNDCLVFGENFLKAVDSVSGKSLWVINDSNTELKHLQLLDFPLVIPDLDADRVKDLLLFFSYIPASNHSDVSSDNYLVIISGRKGTVIAKSRQIKYCAAINNVIFENSSTISYTCYNSDKKESLQTVYLMNLYNLSNASAEKLNLGEKLVQHQKASNTVYLNGFRLTLDNQGTCPENCIVLVNVKDERGDLKNKTIYDLKTRNSFGMTPVVVKSEQEFGFVLKFWKWHLKKQINFASDAGLLAQKTTSSRVAKRKGLSDSLALDKEMLSEGSQRFNRSKRTAYNFYKTHPSENTTNASHFNLHLINETVIRITFNLNDSRILVKKLSEDEIVQICRRPLPCEPDVNQQKYSTLVSDLNEDGREELIMFNSKYVHAGEKTKENSQTWKLRSRIRVINI